MSWNTVTTVWCSVNWDSKEDFKNVKEQEFDTGTLYLRAGISISKSNRFLYLGKVLHLEGGVDKTNRKNIIKCRIKCEVV